MSLPTENLPEWATSGTVVEPSSGKKNTGWVDGEFPPAEYFNWLSKSTYEWLLWVSSVLRGSEYLDWNLVFGNPDSAVPALEISSSAEDHPTNSGNLWRPLIKGLAGADRGVGIYAGRVGASQCLALVVNARWDVTSQTWVQTLNTKKSLAIILDDGTAVLGGLNICRLPAGASPWGDWYANQGGLRVGLLDALSSTLGSVILNTGLEIEDGATVTWENPHTIVDFVDARTGINDANLVYTAGTELISASGSAALHIPLTPIMPRGATLTKVRVLCDTTGGGTVGLEAYRNTVNYAAHTMSIQDMSSTGPVGSSGSALQTLSYTADENNLVQNSASAFISINLGLNCKIYPQIEITYTQVNPRLQ